MWEDWDSDSSPGAGSAESFAATLGGRMRSGESLVDRDLRESGGDDLPGRFE
jgi:hypothetical protein